MSIYQLQNILDSYKIQAIVVNEVTGPSITRYELKLNDGVREASIKKFLLDIARELRVPRVSPVAINDRGLYGLEVPKQSVNIVGMNEVLNSSEFINSDSPLSFSVGKDVDGRIIIGDLKTMPHLLIGGSTGSGKSVFLNTVIVSLIKKSLPDKVRFIMIDPKVVELMPYNDIPHMLYPVITDMSKAVGALEWAVMEMERRYREYEINSKHYNLRIRNIDQFNSYVKEKDQQSHIVIVIDEYADLMISDVNGAKALEIYIQRLGQKARAAGIHLILATQRPDKTVVTGIIKSNISSRISFLVSDAINSRIILDCIGSEKLRGRGDMYYKPAGMDKPLRVQSAYVSDDELEELLGHIVKTNGKAAYDDDVISIINKSGKNKGRRVASYVNPCWTPMIEDVARKSGWDENGEDDAVEFMFVMDEFVNNF